MKTLAEQREILAEWNGGTPAPGADRRVWECRRDDYPALLDWAERAADMMERFSNALAHSEDEEIVVLCGLSDRLVELLHEGE